MFDRIFITAVLCILISLPFILFQKKLSVLGAPTNYTSKKDERKTNRSSIVFSVLILLYTPIIYNKIKRKEDLTLIDKLLFLVYYVGAFVVLYLDPTKTVLSPQMSNYFYLIWMAFFFITLFFTDVSVYIFILFIYGICATTTILFVRKTKEISKYYIFGYILYAFLYLFLLKPEVLANMLGDFNDTTKKDTTPRVNVNFYLYTSVLFFLVLFMLPKIVKDYNGGTRLFNDVMLLNEKQLYDIDDSYPYAISFWINMEAVPPEMNASSAKFTNIVSCMSSCTASVVDDSKCRDDKKYGKYKRTTRNSKEKYDTCMAEELRKCKWGSTPIDAATCLANKPTAAVDDNGATLPVISDDDYRKTIEYKECTTGLPVNTCLENVPVDLQEDYMNTKEYAECVYQARSKFATMNFKNNICGYECTPSNIQCQYNNQISTLKVIFNISNSEVSVEHKILPQSWNHVVIVNDGSTMDVYMNGELKNSVSTMSSTSNILQVGQEDGVAGKICNLTYYKEAITHVSVLQLYNQCKSLDPPIY
jgi:hypothetical protein